MAVTPVTTDANADPTNATRSAMWACRDTSSVTAMIPILRASATGRPPAESKGVNYAPAPMGRSIRNCRDDHRCQAEGGQDHEMGGDPAALPGIPWERRRYPLRIVSHRRAPQPTALIGAVLRVDLRRRADKPAVTAGKRQDTRFSGLWIHAAAICTFRPVRRPDRAREPWPSRQVPAASRGRSDFVPSMPLICSVSWLSASRCR